MRMKTAQYRRVGISIGAATGGGAGAGHAIAGAG